MPKWKKGVPIAGRREAARGMEGQLRGYQGTMKSRGIPGNQGAATPMGNKGSKANKFAHCRNGHNVNKVTMKELIIKNSCRGRRETLSV